jgi:hypothetical protein
MKIQNQLSWTVGCGITDKLVLDYADVIIINYIR